MASYPALDARSAPGIDLQDLLFAELDGLEPLAIQEHDGAEGWRIFFRHAADRDRARDALAAAFPGRLELSPVEVDDEDWARRSQAALTSIEVGRITVSPPWEMNPSSLITDPESLIPDPASLIPRPGSGIQDPVSRKRDADRILIVIEPSMGFGTGHHATTRLCLRLLQQIDVRGQRVADVGTGSGVLALAAWKLGASKVVAIDHDADALQNARANIERNGGAAAIDVLEADLSALTIAPADTVLANLTGAVLTRYAGELTAMTADGGVLVVSGFAPGELQGIADGFGRAPSRVAREGEWAAMILPRLA